MRRMIDRFDAWHKTADGEKSHCQRTPFAIYDEKRKFMWGRKSAICWATCHYMENNFRYFVTSATDLVRRRYSESCQNKEASLAWIDWIIHTPQWGEGVVNKNSEEIYSKGIIFDMTKTNGYIAVQCASLIRAIGEFGDLVQDWYDVQKVVDPLLSMFFVHKFKKRGGEWEFHDTVWEGHAPYGCQGIERVAGTFHNKKLNERAGWDGCFPSKYAWKELDVEGWPDTEDPITWMHQFRTTLENAE